MTARRTMVLTLAISAIAAPQAATAADQLDPATCHHHGMSCSSHSSHLPARVVTVEKANGFDWTDAGIGAASALGAVFVAGGVGALMRRPTRVAA
jgi:hypothetical protein